MASLGLGRFFTPVAKAGERAAKLAGDRKYNVVILGDTHYDREPADYYHAEYVQPNPERDRVHRAEFIRNGEMWRDRSPRLLKRAVELVDGDTRMAFQMGDLIQGDCGNLETHRRMLDDTMGVIKGAFGSLPLVTVVGNHDVRGTEGADEVYRAYMSVQMSRELGKEIDKTTFDFAIGDDAYIVIDFNTPDDDTIEALLKETEGCRHTFIIVHGPVFPYDSKTCRWILHGKEDEARRHFRAEFAQRNAIVLCGHVHRTELLDWRGDGGRITQMTMNSVWKKPELAQYDVISTGAASYGTLRQKNKKLPDESALFDEYRPGIRAYSVSRAAGSYKLNVSDRRVTVDFYGGDSEKLTHRFILR